MRLIYEKKQSKQFIYSAPDGRYGTLCRSQSVQFTISSTTSRIGTCSTCLLSLSQLGRTCLSGTTVILRHLSSFEDFQRGITTDSEFRASVLVCSAINLQHHHNPQPYYNMQLRCDNPAAMSHPDACEELQVVVICLLRENTTNRNENRFRRFLRTCLIRSWCTYVYTRPKPNHKPWDTKPGPDPNQTTNPGTLNLAPTLNQIINPGTRKPCPVGHAQKFRSKFLVKNRTTQNEVGWTREDWNHKDNQRGAGPRERFPLWRLWNWFHK